MSGSSGVEGIADELNTKKLAQKWADFIHSKEFQKITDEVYHQSANARDATHEDDEIDEVELQFAMNILHEKLNAMAKGKLPKPEDDAKELLVKFDEDKSGKLDLQEFRRFAQTYFSRLKWPVWKSALRGAAVGAAGFFTIQFAVAPLAEKFVNVVMPIMIKKVTSEMKKQMGFELKDKFGMLKAKFGDGNPLSDSEQEKAEMAKIERRKRMRKRMKYLKDVGSFCVMGGTAAAAGFI